MTARPVGVDVEDAPGTDAAICGDWAGRGNLRARGQASQRIRYEGGLGWLVHKGAKVVMVVASGSRLYAVQRAIGRWGGAICGVCCGRRALSLGM